MRDLKVEFRGGGSRMREKNMRERWCCWVEDVVEVMVAYGLVKARWRLRLGAVNFEMCTNMYGGT
jgi:hypothetical protein